MTKAKAVFLDRDGVLNEERGYLWLWSDWRWLPGVILALTRLKKAAYKLVVVTNQSGVAKGLYQESDVIALHRRVAEDLAQNGLVLDGYYYCPHHPDFPASPGDDPCACRKPAPGLILAAAKDLDLDLSRSYLVGDKLSDLEAARAAGVKPILVRGGYGSLAESQVAPDIPVVDDLPAAVDLILAKQITPLNLA
ncbi:MAG: D-glycero-beta-D-manno-heptose 1,7-bisphosphate 7-phosphatase [Deltaproteobacteria bacterium]|nr:D-glycero-beta-D-manno-heptose 1,7-bisphosphate 7-phosphatase [Deltaproteobacteria bacterium]